MNTVYPSTSADVEAPRFNLEDLYSGLDDQALWSDIDLAVSRAKSFYETYSGKLATKLGPALTDFSALQSLISRPFVYLSLRQACDAGSDRIQQSLSRARELWSVATANYLTFFEQEIGRTLTDAEYKAQLAADPVVRHHAPYLDQIRELASHMLSAEVERALTLRAPFGAAEWSDYIDEVEVNVRFRVRHPAAPAKALTLTEVLNLTLHHADSDVRFAAMQSVNRTLKKTLAPVTTRALNTVMGEKNLEDAERGYAHIMAARNLENRVPDAMVEALHEAVRTEGAAQARRYYALLAKHLGKKVLRWSDRTAKIPPLGASDHHSIPWHEAVNLVQRAWHGFSPTMAAFVPKMIAAGWVDASPYRGKQSGAFNHAVILPAPHGIRSYTFLNYLNTERDVMTVAHEFGHAVHGLLAGEAQGPLLFHAPLAYAETASIFGEMLVFENLLQGKLTPHRELTLLMDKSSDFVNSVVRQISFSYFEQRAHEARKRAKLTTKELCGIWLDVTAELYGPEGQIFNYSDIDYLWSYVSHFMSPFYVYAYAFGELLTQSLFSMRESIGAAFEPLYLELLRAGGTKNAIELLKPFELDPNDPSFWTRGVKGSLGKWLDRAELLTESIGAH